MNEAETRAELAQFLDLKYGGINEAIPELGEVNEIRELFIKFQSGLFQKRQKRQKHSA